MTIVLTAPEQRSAWIGAKRTLPALGLASACALAALSPVGVDEGQILCPYRLATGGWCPGCGCTRALSAVVRGDLSTSFALNPWTIILLAQAAVISGWFLSAPSAARTWWARNDTRVLQVNLAIGLLIWIARLASGVIPLPL
jgi:hypothetical protein